MKKVSQSPSISCPTCREKFPIDTKFPKNFSILELLDVASEPEHLTPQDTRFCLKLNIFSFIRYCPLHPHKKIKFFCLSCNQSICTLCFEKTHYGHSLERPLKKSKNDKRIIYLGTEIEKELDVNISVCDSLLFETNQMKSLVEIHKKVLFNRKEEEMGRIETEFDKLNHLLTQRKV